MRVHLRYGLMGAVLAASVAAAGADVLSQLGITPDAAKEATGTVITAGVYNPGLPSKAFKLLPPAARAQTVTAGVAWLKSYVNAPDFRQQYNQVRQNHKPQPPSWERTPEQEIQELDDDQKRQMEESKQAIANLPAAQRKAMEDALAISADLTAKMNTPEARKMRLDGIKASRAGETKEYEAAVAKWKQDYPDDPKPVVAKRLREFLQLSADVDYAAKLNPNGTFANPAYQAKPSQWKMCYRAGREATTAARAAVQAWLTELGG